MEYTTKEFINAVNETRLAAKGSWYAWRGLVNDKIVKIKGFETWLQVFDVDDVRYGGAADISVKQFKESLAAPWEF